MNYHVEHHMFPMVPYHALPELHRQVQADLPAPYPSMTAALREVAGALSRQRHERGYFVVRRLPGIGAAVWTRSARRRVRVVSAAEQWIDACGVDDVDREDVLPVQHDGRALAVYHSPDGTFHRRRGCAPPSRHCSRTAS